MKYKILFNGILDFEGITMEEIEEQINKIYQQNKTFTKLFHQVIEFEF